MIVVIGNISPEDNLTIGLHEYLLAIHTEQELSFVECPNTEQEVYDLLLSTLDNINTTKIYTIIDNKYLQVVFQLSKEHKEKCKKISCFLYRSTDYEVLTLANFYNRFIILDWQSYQRLFGVKNIDFLPQPIISRFHKRDKITKPVLTFCGRGKSDHHLYTNYLALADASHNLPCDYLYTEKEVDQQTLLILRQRATHNVLFLDEWYNSNVSASFLDSFVYLLPIISPNSQQIEFYRNGLDIGYLCANAEQMLANVHYVSTSFDNNRYMQQIENLKFIREYFSGTALAKRYSV